MKEYRVIRMDGFHCEDALNRLAKAGFRVIAATAEKAIMERDDPEALREALRLEMQKGPSR